MPEIPRMPPGRRCFARIDRFECECPHCGRLIFAGLDKRYLPKRMLDTSRARAAAKQRPRAESVLRLFWNPYTQRMSCPWCQHVYTLGIVFYPVKNQGRRSPPAPDVEPTPAEVAEMRRLGGGWFVKGGREVLAHANLVVPDGCSCLAGGTDPACPLHGEQALDAAPPPPPAVPARTYKRPSQPTPGEAPAETPEEAEEGGERAWYRRPLQKESARTP